MTSCSSSMSPVSATSCVTASPSVRLFVGSAWHYTVVQGCLRATLPRNRHWCQHRLLHRTPRWTLLGDSMGARRAAVNLVDLAQESLVGDCASRRDAPRPRVVSNGGDVQAASGKAGVRRGRCAGAGLVQGPSPAAFPSAMWGGFRTPRIAYILCRFRPASITFERAPTQPLPGQ
jgi:hypothetical protein